MPFEKGNKLGGRTKGAVNKKTEQWEVFADYCMNGGLQKFEQEIEKLEGKQFVDAFISLLEFHKPKLQRSEVKHDVEEETIKQLIFVTKGSRSK